MYSVSYGEGRTAIKTVHEHVDVDGYDRSVKSVHCAVNEIPMNSIRLVLWKP